MFLPRSAFTTTTAQTPPGTTSSSGFPSPSAARRRMGRMSGCTTSAPKAPPVDSCKRFGTNGKVVGNTT